jgi:hypothetical protein
MVKRVVLREVDYDPKADSASVHAGKSDFSASEGYTIELSPGWVHVSHSGRSVSFPESRVLRVLRDAPSPAPSPNTGNAVSSNAGGKRK